MARRYFPGWSQANLEAKLAELDAALLDPIASGSTGDTSATHRGMENLQKTREMVLNDLRVLDATTYGSSVPIKRTSVSYI
jgi:hypothetical protein